MPKLHEAWPGTNRFCCKMITGPLKDFCANMCFYACVIIAIIPYSIFMFKNIWEISPAIPLLFFAAVALTTLFLNLTSCTDPGIIPRRPFLEREHQKYEKYLAQRIIAENQTDPRRFCDTCRIYRPPRASHCSSCNNCVEVFDHHCPFVNNCVGKRNYRFFVMFLASVMLTIGTFFLNIIVFALTNTQTEVNATAIIIICSVVVGLIAIPLFGFCIFHIYLTCTGKTTRQLLKDIKGEKQESQWCQVDSPLIDYYQQIPQIQFNQLKQQLQKIKKREYNSGYNQVRSGNNSNQSTHPQPNNNQHVQNNI